MNKLELETIGYTKDFFPFSKDEIKELKKVANFRYNNKNPI